MIYFVFGIRIHGYKDTRIQGYKDTRIQGYKDTRIKGHNIWYREDRQYILNSYSKYSSVTGVWGGICLIDDLFKKIMLNIS